MTPAEQIKEQILTLSDALDKRLPNMPQLLRTIHTHLKQDPELVTILAPDDVRIVIMGLERLKNTTLATAAAAKPKAASKINMDDLL